MFNVQQFAKFILTGVMTLLALLIIVFDWKLFGQGPKNFIADCPPDAQGGG
jgi:hypothetical protein